MPFVKQKIALRSVSGAGRSKGETSRLAYREPVRAFFFGIFAPALRAVFKAAALLCAGEWPAASISLMFFPIAFRDLLLISGMGSSSKLKVWELYT
jgi:hypothetical protein